MENYPSSDLPVSDIPDAVPDAIPDAVPDPEVWMNEDGKEVSGNVEVISFYDSLSLLWKISSILGINVLFKKDDGDFVICVKKSMKASLSVVAVLVSTFLNLGIIFSEDASYEQKIMILPLFSANCFCLYTQLLWLVKSSKVLDFITEAEACGLFVRRSYHVPAYVVFSLCYSAVYTAFVYVMIRLPPHIFNFSSNGLDIILLSPVYMTCLIPFIFDIYTRSFIEVMMVALMKMQKVIRDTSVWTKEETNGIAQKWLTYRGLLNVFNEIFAYILHVRLLLFVIHAIAHLYVLTSMRISLDCALFFWPVMASLLEHMLRFYMICQSGQLLIDTHEQMVKIVREAQLRISLPSHEKTFGDVSMNGSVRDVESQVPQDFPYDKPYGKDAVDLMPSGNPDSEPLSKLPETGCISMVNEIAAADCENNVAERSEDKFSVVDTLIEDRVMRRPLNVTEDVNIVEEVSFVDDSKSREMTRRDQIKADGSAVELQLSNDNTEVDANFYITYEQIEDPLENENELDADDLSGVNLKDSIDVEQLSSYETSAKVMNVIENSSCNKLKNIAPEEVDTTGKDECYAISNKDLESFTDSKGCVIKCQSNEELTHMRNENDFINGSVIIADKRCINIQSSDTTNTITPQEDALAENRISDCKNEKYQEERYVALEQRICKCAVNAISVTAAGEVLTNDIEIGDVSNNKSQMERVVSDNGQTEKCVTLHNSTSENTACREDTENGGSKQCRRKRNTQTDIALDRIGDHFSEMRYPDVLKKMTDKKDCITPKNVAGSFMISEEEEENFVAEDLTMQNSIGSKRMEDNVPGKEMEDNVPGKEMEDNVPGKEMEDNVPGKEMEDNVPGKEMEDNVPENIIIQENQKCHEIDDAFPLQLIVKREINGVNDTFDRVSLVSRNSLEDPLESLGLENIFIEDEEKEDINKYAKPICVDGEYVQHDHDLVLKVTSESSERNLKSCFKANSEMYLNEKSTKIRKLTSQNESLNQTVNSMSASPNTSETYQCCENQRVNDLVESSHSDDVVIASADDSKVIQSPFIELMRTSTADIEPQETLQVENSRLKRKNNEADQHLKEIDVSMTTFDAGNEPESKGWEEGNVENVVYQKDHHPPEVNDGEESCRKGERTLKVNGLATGYEASTEISASDKQANEASTEISSSDKQANFEHSNNLSLPLEPTVRRRCTITKEDKYDEHKKKIEFPNTSNLDRLCLQRFITHLEEFPFNAKVWGGQPLSGASYVTCIGIVITYLVMLLQLRPILSDSSSHQERSGSDRGIFECLPS